MALIMVALGGNAILRPNEKGTYAEQLQNILITADTLVDLIEEGHKLVITHGNGPQVGNLLIQNEAGEKQVPPLPLDVCGAQTQGQLGYMIQQVLENRLRRRGISQQVVTVVTRVLVQGSDPAFAQPSKPVGPFHAEEYARQRIGLGESWIEDSGRGWRKVVPSPEPICILELEVIRNLFQSGAVVIAVGGGGIPVVEQEDQYVGIEAVIDKDLAGSLLASRLEADVFLILTDVDHVSLSFGTSEQKHVQHLSVLEAEKYLAEDQFKAGSMGPKVLAAIRFVKAGGQKAIIAALQNGNAAVNGRSGTTITR